LQFQKRYQLFICAHLSAPLSRDQVHREFVYRRLQFDERSQQVVGADDETFRRCVMP